MASNIIFYGKAVERIVDKLKHITECFDTWASESDILGYAVIPEGSEKEATRALRKEQGESDLTYIVMSGPMRRPRERAYI